MDAKGKKHTVRKADVEGRRLTDQPLMPDGLNTGLSPAEFAALIAYFGVGDAAADAAGGGVGGDRAVAPINSRGEGRAGAAGGV